jgi:Ca2+-binding RTX toxin-like protein
VPPYHQDFRNRPAITAIQIVGGPAKDAVVIGGDFEEDVVLGDSGRVRIHQGVIYEIESTELANGGAAFDADTIGTGDAGDLVLGGNGPDVIAAGTGDDIVLGDNARITLFQGRIIGLEHESYDGWQLNDCRDHGHDDDHDGDQYDDRHYYGDDHRHDDDDHHYSHEHGHDDDHDHGRRDFDPYDVPGIELLGAAIGGGDTIEGGADDDLMYGQFGDDTYVFSGGALGNDRVIEAGETDCDLPNDLRDRLDFSGFVQAIDIDLGTTDRQLFASGTTVNLKLTLSSSTGLEGVLGSAFDDDIDGNSRDNFLYGLVGNDEIEGEDGDDLLEGGLGNDCLYGGDGNDRLYGGDGDDALYGGAGDDVLEGGVGIDRLYGDSGDDLLDGGAGNDRIEGGSGHDLLTFAGATTGAVVTLTSGGNGTAKDGQGGTDILRTSIEGAIGTDWADTLTGNDECNEFRGMGGSDLIDGKGGDDVLLGGAGNDRILGDRGNDYIEGGAGDDVIDAGRDDDVVVWHEGEGNDTIDMGDGSQDRVCIITGASDDVLMVTSTAKDKVTVSGTTAGWGINLIRGDVIDIDTGAGNDRVTVGNLANTDVNEIVVVLGAGNDRLDASASSTSIRADGGAGNDVLIGGSGADVLCGGTGDDQLFGGAGKDCLDGGPGVDLITDPDDRNWKWWE